MTTDQSAEDAEFEGFVKRYIPKNWFDQSPFEWDLVNSIARAAWTAARASKTIVLPSDEQVDEYCNAYANATPVPHSAFILLRDGAMYMRDTVCRLNKMDDGSGK